MVDHCSHVRNTLSSSLSRGPRPLAQRAGERERGRCPSGTRPVVRAGRARIRWQRVDVGAGESGPEESSSMAFVARAQLVSDGRIFRARADSFPRGLLEITRRAFLAVNSSTRSAPFVGVFE